jgi:protein-S-isoprenylcysteine O-methyltransferase Ste14
MAPRSDNPGVWFPPPVWYLLAVLIGVLLNRRWPLPVAEGPLTIVAGICFVAGWMALAFFRGAAALVPSGPYRYTRNPMYVSLALLTIACGLLLATWWPILLLVPTLAIVRQFVILPEERYLRRRFGAEYEGYARRVRRWL